MKNSNPLIPQGTLLDQKNRRRARVRLAFSFIFSIHFIALMVLLIQGCKREQPSATEPEMETNIVAPAFEPTNEPMVESNLPAPNAVVPPPVTTPPVTPPPVVTPPQATQAPLLESHEYTIAAGDTFSGIAKKTGVSVKAIQQANPTLDPRRLQIGQKIIIPSRTEIASPGITAPSGPVESGGETVYVVKSGDTLSKIARHYGVTVSAIRSANNLITDRILVGQKLKIPIKPTAPAPATGMEAPPTTPAPPPQ
ncbi:MAG TPA: LysM peptidoglycan-binding domain-containing protein [Verrucomicrobiae bacterium]|nr:LysM peptidoglycan-binding domain-containing protein [Verrucomicrobiae bacterium]